MAQINSVTLSLSSFNLSTTSPNQYGVTNSAFTNMRFDNINMRLLLGDLYGKYKRFNIALVTEMCSGGNNSETNLIVKMSGLSFINNAYDNIENNNTSFVNIGYIKRGASGVSSMSYVQNVYNTFPYSNDVVSISIKLFNNSNIQSSATFGNAHFLFVITPVD